MVAVPAPPFIYASVPSPLPASGKNLWLVTRRKAWSGQVRPHSWGTSDVSTRVAGGSQDSPTLCTDSLSDFLGGWEWTASLGWGGGKLRFSGKGLEEVGVLGGSKGARRLFSSNMRGGGSGSRVGAPVLPLALSGAVSQQGSGSFSSLA